MGGFAIRLPASRKMDMVLQILPVHCHMPHPPGVPIPHPAQLYKFESALAEKVKIAFMPAACFLSQTNQCMLSGCSPGGPGKLILGSFKVFYAGKPAARMIGLTLHMSCLAPIPGPLGLVITGWPLVLVGL